MVDSAVRETNQLMVAPPARIRMCMVVGDAAGTIGSSSAASSSSCPSPVYPSVDSRPIPIRMVSNRHRFHIVSSLLLLFLSSSSMIHVVRGSDLFITQPELPDWSSIHTLLPFIFFLITYPTYIVSAILLRRKSQSYPIAGRGFIYLFATNMVLLVSSPLLTLLSMIYPHGVPCGLVFLAAATSVLPLSYCYMIRGWKLVFQLEIMNYLAEVRLLEIQNEKKREAAEEAAEEDKQKMRENKKQSLSVGTDDPTGAKAKITRQTSLGLRRFRMAENAESANAPAATDADPNPIPTIRIDRFHAEDGLETISLDTNQAHHSTLASPTQSATRGSNARNLSSFVSSSATLPPIVDPDHGRGSMDSSMHLTVKGGPATKYLTPNHHTQQHQLPQQHQTQEPSLNSESNPTHQPTEKLLQRQLTRSKMVRLKSMRSNSSFASYPPPVDMSSIAGHWFVRHRHLIDAKWIAAFFVSLSSLFFFVALLVFLILPDPDVDVMNREMVRQGEWPADEPPYFTRSQLHPSEILYGAPCMLRTAKMLYVQFCIIGLLTPLVFWIVLRLRANARRTAELKARGLPEPTITLTGLAHIRATHQNDTDAVKHELTCIAGVALYIIGAYPIFSYFAKPFILFDVLLPLLMVECVSLAHPLFVSLRLSRAHRAFLRSEQLRSLTPAGLKDGSKLPHHRPYFRLHFILRSEHTYPIFLKFLEKEYSSENALFIRQVRNFERLAKMLERRIPTWTTIGEEEIGPHEQAGGHGAANAGWAGKQSQIGSSKRNWRTNHIGSGHGGVMVTPATRSRRASSQHRGSSNKAIIGPVAVNASGMLLPGAVAGSSVDSEGEEVPTLPIELDTATTDPARASTSTMAHAHVANPTHSPVMHHLSTPSPTLRPLQSGTPKSRSRGLPPTSARTGSRDTDDDAIAPQRATGMSTRQPLMIATGSKDMPSVNTQTIASNNHVHLHMSTPSPASPTHASVNKSSSKLSRNLYSFDELTNFHTSAREVRKMCLDIQRTFLTTGADQEVNLPDDLHSLVLGQVELLKRWHPSPFDETTQTYFPLRRDTPLPIPPPFPLSTLFKQASMTVFELIQKDSFRRFLQTDAFLEMLLAADEAELLKQQAEESLEAQTQAVMQEAILKIRIKEEEAGGFHGQQILAMPVDDGITELEDRLDHTRPPRFDGYSPGVSKHHHGGVGVHLSSKRTSNNSLAYGLLTPAMGSPAFGATNAPGIEPPTIATNGSGTNTGTTNNDDTATHNGTTPKPTPDTAFLLANAPERDSMATPNQSHEPTLEMIDI